MRRVPLAEEIRRTRPDVTDPEGAIASGLVRVDGVVVHNARSMVRPGCAIVVERPADLRGSAKLRAALDRFRVDVTGLVCVDVGASTGGFTTVLLERGATRVYAVDVGHGQLLGSLRQDDRVVNLEATNVADVTAELVPEPVGLVTIDVSYLSLGDAVSQLSGLAFERGCVLVGLVKPMFELALATAPIDEASLGIAIDRAGTAIASCGWEVVATAPSPVPGGKGAIEGFLHARVAR